MKKDLEELDIPFYHSESFDRLTEIYAHSLATSEKPENEPTSEQATHMYINALRNKIDGLVRMTDELRLLCSWTTQFLDEENKEYVHTRLRLMRDESDVSE